MPGPQIVPYAIVAKFPMIPEPPGPSTLAHVSASIVLFLATTRKIKSSPFIAIGVASLTWLSYTLWTGVRYEQLKALLDEELRKRGACKQCRKKAYRLFCAECYAEMLDDLEKSKDRSETRP